MKNPILVLGLLAVLAVGAWLALRGSAPVDPGSGLALEQEVEAVAPVAGRGGDPAAAGLSATEAGDPPLPDGPASTERTEVVVEAPEGAALGPAEAPTGLRVLVLDATETPYPGLEVQVVHRLGNWDSVQLRETTGEDGIATFKGISAASFGGEGLLAAKAAFVRLDVLTAERIDAPLDESLLGREEPIVLRLPPMGSVAVHVLDVDHGPPLGTVSVKLSHVPEGESREVSPFGNTNRTWVTVAAEAGVARFPLVACGIDVNAVATRDINNVPCSAFGPGPLRPGEEVRLDARFGESHPVVQLRALDETGVPMAGASIAVTIEGVGGFMMSEHEIFPRTDGEGRLRIDLEPEPDEKVTRSLILVGPSAGAGMERPLARVELSQALPNGLTDLGDVTLGSAPLFVAGRVVDDAGRPLPDLELRLDRQERKDQGWWDRDQDFRVRSDADGRFEVSGVRPGEAFRVTAVSDDHASRWTRFEPGAQDVLVQLTQAGGIAGRLQLDPGVDATMFRIYLKGAPEGELVSGSSEVATPAADGSFAFDGLLTGAGRRIEIRTEWVWSELATVEGLDVVAGQVLRDPRLDPLDLRGKLFVHELVVVGGDESARLSGQLQFGPVGSERLTFEGYMSGRTMKVATPYERIDLKAKYRGYRSIALSDVGGHVELPLQESLEVTIVLLGGAELPKPPIFVKAGLVPVGGGHSDLDLGGDPFDERREVRTKSPGVGRMEVHWILERRMANGGFATSFAPPEPRYVEVLEGVEGQRFEISVTQEELDEIVGRLP